MRGAMMATKRTKKPISLSEKLKIVNKAAEGASRADIAKEFGVSASTVCKIIQKSDKVREECAEGHGNVKRKRKSDAPELENRLVE